MTDILNILVTFLGAAKSTLMSHLGVAATPIWPEWGGVATPKARDKAWKYYR